MRDQDIQGYVSSLVVWAILTFLVYTFWRWCAGYLLPFLAAFLLAAVAEPVVMRLQSWGFARGWAVLISLLGLLLGLFMVLGAMITLLGAELVQASHRLPQLLRSRSFHVEQYFNEWNRLRIEFGLKPGSLNGELHSLYQVIALIVRALAHVLVRLPDIGLMAVVASLAAFFILRDFELVVGVIKKAFPPGLRPRLGRLTNDVVGGLLGFLRAEGILVSLTGLSTTAGLLLAGAPYAVLIGLTAGLLDMVPFMGPTVLLVPWAVGAVLIGHVSLAMRLLMVLACVAVVRQTVEPRLVGRGTGLHPLVVLFSLYIGIRLFGAAGVVVGPMTAVFMNALARARSAPPIGVDT